MSKRKRAPRRTASRKAGPANPFAGAPGLSEEEILRLMSEALQQGMDAGLFDSKSAVAQFAEFLESCGNDEGADEEPDARTVDLIGELDQLRIACNGGDRAAREDMQAILELLNTALDDGGLRPIDLIMTGKIFHDAGWTVPDRLKEAVGQSLQHGIGDDSSTVVGDLPSLLLEILQNLESSPFDIHEFVSSLLAAFPAEAYDNLLSALAALCRPEVSLALAGFVAHSDAKVARAAVDVLRALAGRAPVESLLVERLVQMRPWLPQARQVQLDSAIKALRPHAAPPQVRILAELVECYASVCDGSGTNSASISQRTGNHYRLASVMMKPSGISEVMVIPELSKTEIGHLLREMRSAVPTSKTDTAGVSRLLRLALAGNAATGSLPPFRLIEVVESLGLPPLHADHASASEIIEELLAGLPKEQTNASAVAKAHADLLNEEFVGQWFEAGEALEDLLRPIGSFPQRVTAVMTTYLPPRRQYWARQCAVSALAMRADTGNSRWKRLGLVGRDIASDLPLERIPLMRSIAATSVHAFDSQM